MGDLKSCPWCKGNNIITSTYLSHYEGDKGYSAQAYCKDCSAGCTESQVYSDEESAREAAEKLWNFRPIEAKLEAENARLVSERESALSKVGKQAEELCKIKVENQELRKRLEEKERQTVRLEVRAAHPDESKPEVWEY